MSTFFWQLHLYFAHFFFNITFKNHSLYNVDVHNFPLP